MDSLYILADNEVYYDDAATQAGVALTALTVTFEVLTAAGASLSPAVTGTCSHVADGDYTGVISSTTVTASAFTPGNVYLVAVTATGGGYDDYRRFPVQAAYRGKG